jgi:hypothetical protein
MTGKQPDREEMTMHVFDITKEQQWDPKKHVEKVLAELELDAGQAGDYTVACWEPGQISPHHCHLFLLLRRRQDAHADRHGRRGAGLVLRPPAG